jgi:hypothetical protein
LKHCYQIENALPNHSLSLSIAGQRDLNRTLFGQEWLFVVVDEIHTNRNESIGYRSVFMLREKCKAMVGLSATPILTGLQVSIYLLTRIIAEGHIGCMAYWSNSSSAWL